MNNFFDAIGIDLGILVVMLMVLVLVLIVLVLNVSLGLHRQRRRYNMFMKGADGQSLERVFSQKLKEVDRLSRANEQSLGSQGTEGYVIQVPDKIRDRKIRCFR